MKQKSFQDLAITRALSGDFKTALETYYAAREKQIKVYGNDPYQQTVNKMEIQIAAVLYLRGEFDEAFKLFTETLKKIEKHPEEFSDDIFEAKCYLATLYSRKMNRDEARRLYCEMREYIDNLPDHNKKVAFKRNLGMSLKQSGELNSALELFTEIYNGVRGGSGETTDITAYSHGEVGMVLLEQGKYKEALTMLEKAHNAFSEETGEDISYLRIKRHLADAHMSLGLVKIAEDLYKSLVDKLKHVYPFHPDVLVTLHNWGRSLTKLDKPNEALAILKEVYCIRHVQSPKHPDTAKIALDIATINLYEKQYIDAIISFADVPAQISSTIKWNPDLLIYSLTSIVSIFDASSDVIIKEQILKLYQHVFTKQYQMRGLSDHHKEVLQTRTRIGELLISLKKPDEALEILKDVLEKRTLVLKNDYTDCVDVMNSIANAYSALGRYVEAFEYYSEAYETQRLITGDNSFEAVNGYLKISQITNKMKTSDLIDAVVSKYKASIKAKTDPENVEMEDNFPLHVASEIGRIAMVKFLLFKGAIYNKENSEGKTPADIACNDAVKSFFDFIHSLFLDFKNVDNESIDQKLDVMDDTRLRDDAVRDFPMFLTGEERILSIVDKTILNARNETGSTPLHLACSNGDAKTVKRLLTLKVDHTLKDKSNKSARNVAEEKGFTDVIQLLDSYILKQNKNIEGRTITKENPEIPEDVMDQ